VDLGLKKVGSLSPGSGLFKLAAGFNNDGGRIDGLLEHRVSEEVSIFASANIDTHRQWEAMTGIKIEW